MFERHKSGAFHIHALVHSDQKIPTDVLRRPWQAGFNDVKMCDVRGAAYVVKYSTKSLLDNTTRSRPRIRASHGYGRAVMLADKEAVREAMAAKPSIPVQETWTTNLIEAVRSTEIEGASKPIWEFLMEVQAAHGTITIGEAEFRPPNIDGQTIDRETGEVLPYGKPQRPRTVPPEALTAIKESKAMGLLYKHGLLNNFEKRLSELLINASTSGPTATSTTTSTTGVSSKRGKKGTNSQGVLSDAGGDD